MVGARFERVGRPSEVNHLVDLGYPTDNYVEPRFGFAYAPVWSQGLLGKLTGGQGKSVLRFYFPHPSHTYKTYTAEELALFGQFKERYEGLGARD